MTHQQGEKQVLTASATPKGPQPRLTARELFGGAITCDVFDEFDDVSSLRQIPDHQEVFCSRAAKTDSLIVELLDDSCFASHPIPQEFAEYHLRDVFTASAQSPGVEQQVGLSVRDVSSDVGQESCGVAIGWQQVLELSAGCSAGGGPTSPTGGVRKPPTDGKERGEKALVVLACLRFADVSTDILITFNCTGGKNEAAASAEENDRDSIEKDDALEQKLEELGRRWGTKVVDFLRKEKRLHVVPFLLAFPAVLRSFRIKDKGLFI